MTDQDIRDLLERMTAEEPVPFFDAESLTRRARRRAARTVVVAAVGVAAVVALLFTGASQLREASPSVPATDPTATPRPSPSPGSSTFTSTIHGLSIVHPSDWQVRPATEPWNHDPFTFDAPGVDVIFDPTLQDDLYLSLASRPLDGQSAEEWCCSELWAASEVCETGGNFGRIAVDGASATVRGCDGVANRFEDHVVQVATATRGYVIYLHVADDPDLQATYTEDWFDAVLETIELR